MVTLFNDLDREQAHTFSLVLNAVGIGHRLSGPLDCRRIEVPESMAEEALEAIHRYQAENPSTTDPSAAIYEPTYTVNISGIAVALVLLAAHLAVASSAAPEDYITAFGANARRIVHGDLYRCITALFLHADIAHLAGNMVGTALFGGAVCAVVGTGVGWLMILACGFSGNLINAWIYETGHLSIGASTAVFGAVGILCALQAVNAVATGKGWKGFLMVLGAGVALLAFLGASTRSDLGAHLFGFLCGLAAGLLFRWSIGRAPGKNVQRLCGIAAAIVPVAAWIKGY